MALDTYYIHICHNFPICIEVMMIYKDISWEQQFQWTEMHPEIIIKYLDFLLSTERPLSVHILSARSSQGQTYPDILYIFSYFQPPVTSHQSQVSNLFII